MAAMFSLTVAPDDASQQTHNVMYASTQHDFPEWWHRHTCKLKPHTNFKAMPAPNRAVKFIHFGILFSLKEENVKSNSFLNGHVRSIKGTYTGEIFINKEVAY
jgi:hypothetical protein